VKLTIQTRKFIVNAVGGVVKKSTKALLWAMLAHFAVDATTVAALLRTESNGLYIGFAILLYDALAFAVQPLFGLIVDRKTGSKVALAGGLILAGAGSILLRSPILIAIVCGLGNAFAHVGGFGLMFTHQPNKIAPLGLFVSTGSLGLGVGTLFSSFHLYYAILAIGIGIFLIINRFNASVKNETKPILSWDKPILIVPLVIVLLSVFLRGFAGTLASAEYSKTTLQAFFIYFAVFAGKALGGWIADTIGMQKTVLFFLLPAAVGLFGFRDTEWIYLLSLALFNISMPICLALTITLLRKLPAFAFGLTAALLMVGTFFALVSQSFGLPKDLLIVTSAILSAVGILYTLDRLKKEEESTCVF
jgi:FSR family fosmidomycin resistance protein-like MFS transporter